MVSVITILSSVFAYVYMMGGGRGGPGTSTMVVELYIFNALIRTSLPGIASAVSVMLFLVSLLADRAAVPRAPPRQRGGRGLGAAVAIGAGAAARHPGAATLVALAPTVFMLLTSLKSQAEYTFNKVGLPQDPVFDHFRRCCSTVPSSPGWATASCSPPVPWRSARSSPASAPTPSRGCGSRAGSCCSRPAPR